MPQINVTTIQTAFAVVISNMITGFISWFGAWSKLPLSSPDNAALITILSIMLSTLIAVALIGWYTRSLALVSRVAPADGTTKIVTDEATAKSLPDNPNVTSARETKVVTQ